MNARHTSLHDWLALQRSLAATEHAFARLVSLVAEGAKPVAELHFRRAELLELRSRCDALYDQAMEVLALELDGRRRVRF